MSEHDIDQSLVQLRQAMRLCFEYQQSMLSVAYYIKNKLRFPVVKGYKHFSDALSPRHTLLLGTWAWDFLPSYFFEYYLDSRSFEEQGLYLKAALLQLSDDGCYAPDCYGRKGYVNENGCPQPAAFEPSDTSDSWLTFLLDVSKKENQFDLWLKKGPDGDYKSLLKDLFSTHRRQDQQIFTYGSLDLGEMIIAQKFKFQHFVDQACTDAAIKTFCDVVQEKTGLDLLA